MSARNCGRRLLCLASDPLEAYAAKGTLHPELARMNPLGCFRRLYVSYQADRSEVRKIGRGIVALKSGKVLRGKSLLGKAFAFPFNFFRQFAANLCIIRRARIDVIRSYSPYLQGMMGVLLQLAARRPCTVSLHSDYAAWRKLDCPTTFHRLAFALLERLSVRFARRVICLSRYLSRYAQRLGAPASRVRLLPNGVELSRFSAPAARRAAREFRRSLALERNDQLVCHIGRLDPGKNIHELVQAFRSVAKEHPSVRLLLVGTGRLAEDIRQKVVEHGLQRSVILTGVVDHSEVPAILSASTLFVLPSLNEGCPNALLEAYAAALPAIVSNIPQIEEFAGPAITYTPGNADELAAAIIRLLSDPDLRSRMAAAGPQFVRDFEYSAIRAQEVAIYKELLSEHDR